MNKKSYCERCGDEIGGRGTHCQVCAEIISQGPPKSDRKSWLPQGLPPDHTDILDPWAQSRQLKSAKSMRRLKNLNTVESDPDSFGLSD